MRASDGDIYEFIYTPGKWFKIPDFQRPYSWHRENCKELLEDLEDLIDSDKTHFFGSVVYESKGDESIIIDGQQRITTISLMIMAIYHLVLEDSSLTGDHLPAAEIKERFLWNERHSGDSKNRVKLRGITKDAEIFQQIYDQDIKFLHENSEMCQVYRYFRDYFADKQDLHRYIEALKRLKIVKILLDPRDDRPQKIFEKINATGKELGDGDKIRNFALMMDNDAVRTRVFDRYWAKVEQRLVDSSARRDDIKDFFWRLLVSNAQKAVKVTKDVYPEFKKFFNSRVQSTGDEEQIDQFWQEVLGDLDRYCLLKYPDEDPGEMAVFKNSVDRLGYLAIGVYFPYLMKVLKRWHDGQLTSEQVESIIATTEVYLVRRGLLQYGTQGLNNFYATLDKNIWEKLSGSQSSYEDVYRYVVINSGYECPTPESLESRLMGMNFYRMKGGLKYFILSSYDDKKLPKESSLLNQLSQRDSNISIEHIMPQSLNRAWKTDLGDNWPEVHDKYRDSLANLTLTGYNSEYSNRSFSDKLNAPNGFSQSSLAINRDSVAVYEVFNEESLTKRMDWWLKTIEWIWPYPESDYSPALDGSGYKELTLGGLAASDLSYSKPQAVIFRQQAINTDHWTDVLDVIVDRIYDDDAHLIDKLKADPEVGSEISQYGQDFVSSVEISDSDWLVNTDSTPDDKVKFLNRVLDLANVDQQDVRIKFSQSAPGTANKIHGGTRYAELYRPLMVRLGQAGLRHYGRGGFAGSYRTIHQTGYPGIVYGVRLTRGDVWAFLSVSGKKEQRIYGALKQHRDKIDTELKSNVEWQSEGDEWSLIRLRKQLEVADQLENNPEPIHQWIVESAVSLRDVIQPILDEVMEGLGVEKADETS